MRRRSTGGVTHPCLRSGLLEDQKNHIVNQANELDYKGQPQVLCTHQLFLMRYAQTSDCDTSGQVYSLLNLDLCYGATVYIEPLPVRHVIVLSGDDPVDRLRGLQPPQLSPLIS
ncbi:hypothetical protein PS673_02030 [Pseudomonas fluorescens]|jgi:hypothetical protein|uniref:Uncharacterized protein n=1 Tax=Pseudomonas fluorescens TaxID=294 RepID=A0A5E6SFE8_PSEFL|nr:hypothetical protein PS673_02030 [Pseudomonas fluorescens]